jgi:hypothetical protein
MDSRQSAEGRSASFDYCFNYFQDFRERGCIEAISERENMQLSCLQLAFFLASWGMLRPRSQLLQRSVKFHERLIVRIVQSDRKAWEVDIDSYSDENIDLLLCVKGGICEVLATAGVTDTDTLVTKIMLGVYGNIPAFDRYFRKGLDVGTVNKENLKRIARFYQDHKSEIDAYGPIHTLDFRTGVPTRRQYTKAKIVDMIGHVSGW